MAWKPKVIEGSRSEPKAEPKKKRGGVRPQEAFTLGIGGFKKVDKPTGDALWDFLDLDTKRKD